MQNVYFSFFFVPGSFKVQSERGNDFGWLVPYRFLISDKRHFVCGFDSLESCLMLFFCFPFSGSLQLSPYVWCWEFGTLSSWAGSTTDHKSRGRWNDHGRSKGAEDQDSIYALTLLSEFEYESFVWWFRNVRGHAIFFVFNTLNSVVSIVSGKKYFL